MGIIDKAVRNAARSARHADYRSLALFCAILVFFFVSGACGLLYQVVWTRKLVLLLGTASYAVSTVLSVFFLGLAAGSLWGGRLADRARRPLFVYGLFELLIGAWAVLFILLADRGEGLVVALLRIAGEGAGHGRLWAVVPRAALASSFLLVPVTLMGATLPLLARFVTSSERTLGLRIGALYSINTFGAVAGCACTGFVLLANLGYSKTTYIGAAANIAIGLVAMAISARIKPRSYAPETAGAPEASPLETAGDRPALTHVERLVIAAFAVSGFCALALEVLWTRLLTIVFIGTTYAFTTMLAALLCGLALGSTVASLFIDKRRRPVLLFGGIELFLGVACLAMLPVFASLPERFQQMQIDAGFDWARLVRVKLLLSFATLFPPTFLFGMTFPVVVRAATTLCPRLGRDIGVVYSANTFGGMLGALAGGYFLLPMLGTHGGIVALSLALCAVGVVLVLASPGGAQPSAKSIALKGATLALGAVLFAAVWIRLPEDVGQAMNRGYLPNGETMIHYREGVEGTVAVSEPEDVADGSNRTLWINGVQATASIEKGVRMNRLQGVLPLVFDRDPRTALFMCFGSGITAGTLSQGPFERIDAVEIAEDVLEAAPLFATDNLNVIENGQVHFVVDDGRNFLLTTPRKYDVITFEPMPLALAGVSTFYTSEYYRLCLDHLSPGGIVSQWVPLHSLDPDVVRALTATFIAVFPEYCAWYINADLFLIGSNAPLAIDYARAVERTREPRVHEALRAVGLEDPAELLSCFFMTKARVNEYVASRPARVPPMSDDWPWAEFVAPRLMYARTVADTLEEITPFYESALTLTRFDGFQGDVEGARAALDRRYKARRIDLEGITRVYGGMVGAGQEEPFLDSLAVDPANYTARHYLQQIAAQQIPLFLRWDQADKALAFLERVIAVAPDVPDFQQLLGDTLAAMGKQADAKQAYERARALNAKAPSTP